jgi:hypothetical protein
VVQLVCREGQTPPQMFQLCPTVDIVDIVAHKAQEAFTVAAECKVPVDAPVQRVRSESRA